MTWLQLLVSLCWMTAVLVCCVAVLIGAIVKHAQMILDADEPGLAELNDLLMRRAERQMGTDARRSH